MWNCNNLHPTHPTRSPLGVDPAPAMFLDNTLGLFPFGLALGSGLGAGAVEVLCIPGSRPRTLKVSTPNPPRFRTNTPLAQTHAPVGRRGRRGARALRPIHTGFTCPVGLPARVTQRGFTGKGLVEACTYAWATSTDRSSTKTVLLKPSTNPSLP